MISFLLCLLLAHSFSKPVRLIKKAATKLGQGDFDTRVEGVSQLNGELGQLATSFNVMAEQLQQNQTAQRRLLGDVSHELRSPLTRLQMALGLAQQDSTSTEGREQYLQRCQREIDRLDHMIENVLSLSRLENTLHTTESEQVNMSALIKNIVNDEQFVADKKSISIEVNTPENVIIEADQTLLTSAISNVLSNAVKYSPESSVIEVTLTTDKQHVTLVISDCGEGVPEEALTQLFTPFYRVNLARDRNTGGTGLGLAIAKQAITAHQGEIFAKNNANKGLSVIIHIPYL
ncbi:ATP-binding protein [Colwellia sp. MSW7]|uniref:histidine kinase n=1 Tax=Colwellia maritima TaxID=2912588 RepID=A0ABS9X6G7_9GAMM|nr:ATP-binding protein [Colwellia maritima]MCI2285809.1 ATP-binding protein [Colwellia maritima]